VKITLPATAGPCIDVLAETFAGGDLFYGHGTDNPGSEAQWLVCAVLTQAGISEINRDTPIAPAAQGRIAKLARQRMDERTPLAYLLREAWFAGHCFYVDERVLVPRSPIAELITGGFDTLVARPPARILDLCCGGGCIGIAAALALPQAEVVLADLSEQALAVAAENITRFALADRVTCTQSDLFAAIEGRFDLILCNPPYVSDAEYRDLPAEYRHEPVMGLVSADDGLAIPLQVLAQAAHHLAPDGVLVLETGYTWPDLADACPTVPFLWLDFEHGGEGVCALPRAQLATHFPA